MKHFSEQKRKKMTEPMHKVFPELNQVLQKHGMENFIIKEITLAEAHNNLKCDKGSHVETFCDHLGRCYPICVKDPPNNENI